MANSKNELIATLLTTLCGVVCWGFNGAGALGQATGIALAPTTVLFPFPSYALTVAKTGIGGGLVTGAGINCGADCAETLVENTMVTLSATPNAFSTFTGWSGSGCSGVGTESVR